MPGPNRPRARILNESDSDIYVTIEDAAEVDAREELSRGFAQAAPEQRCGLSGAVEAEQFRRHIEEAFGRHHLVPVHPRNMEDLLQMLGGQATAGADAEASRRARELLLSHCTEEQAASWERSHELRAVGSQGNLYVIDEKGVTRLADRHAFCLQVVGEQVPVEDAVLMRKLLIETNEPEFLRLANDLTVRGGQIDEDYARRRRQAETAEQVMRRHNQEREARRQAHRDYHENPGRIGPSIDSFINWLSRSYLSR